MCNIMLIERMCSIEKVEKVVATTDHKSDKTKPHKKVMHHHLPGRQSTITSFTSFPRTYVSIIQLQSIRQQDVQIPLHGAVFAPHQGLG